MSQAAPDITVAAPPITYVPHPAREQREAEGVVFDKWVLPDGTPWATFHRQAAGYLLRFPNLADFEVSVDGRRVQEWRVPGIGPSTIQHLYLNQILPLALSRQGRLVLHGSAVEIGGLGVAFIGESGRGKSTLAASFATQGRPFLTDDGLQLDWGAAGLSIVPSHPSIRLWEDSEQALVTTPVDVAPPLDYSSKTRFLAGPGIAFCGRTLPLRKIYYLGAGEAGAPAFQAMKQASALMELVRNSFLLDIGEKDMLAWHFEELARIANLPIHYHLDYPRRYEDLPGVKDAIARHAMQGPAE